MAKLTPSWFRCRSFSVSRECVVSFALLLSGCAAPWAREPSQTKFPVVRPVNVSFEYELGCPVFQAELPDGHAGWFLLDTGNGTTNFVPNVAPRATTRSITEQGTILDRESTIPFMVARDCAISMGGVRFEHFDAESVPYPPELTSKLHGEHPLSGAFGWRIFADTLLTVDYAAHRLTLDRGALPPPNGFDILPLRVTAAHDDLEVPATLDGHQVWLTLDTCSFGRNVSISPMTAAGLRWAYTPKPVREESFGGESVSNVGRIVGDLHIGRYTITQPIVAQTSANQDVLCGPTLSHFAITLDVRNRRVRLLPSAEATVACDTFVGESAWADRQENVSHPRFPNHITLGLAAVREGVTLKTEGSGTKVVARPNGDRLVFSRRGVLAYLSGKYTYKVHLDGGLEVDNNPHGISARWYERATSASGSPELVLLDPFSIPYFRHVDPASGVTTTIDNRLTIFENPNGSSHTILSDGLTIDWSAAGDVIVD